jgi:AcrR family transcriptional regulator
MPTRSPQQKRRAARDRRRRVHEELILDAAEAVFAERGLDAAKVQEIADEAGFSLGTLYKLFRGKAEIVSRVHERRGDALFAAGEAAIAEAGHPLTRLLGFVTAYLHELVAHPDYLRMHLGDASAWGFGDRFASRSQLRAWRRGFDLEVGLFEEGIARGVFLDRDPALQVRMMAAVQQVQLAHWLEGGMRIEPSRLIGEMRIDFVRCFCRPEVVAWLAAAPSDPTPPGEETDA